MSLQSQRSFPRCRFSLLCAPSNRKRVVTTDALLDAPRHPSGTRAADGARLVSGRRPRPGTVHRGVRLCAGAVLPPDQLRAREPSAELCRSDLYDGLPRRHHGLRRRPMRVLQQRDVRCRVRHADAAGGRHVRSGRGLRRVDVLPLHDVRAPVPSAGVHWRGLHRDLPARHRPVRRPLCVYERWHVRQRLAFLAAVKPHERCRLAPNGDRRGCSGDGGARCAVLTTAAAVLPRCAHVAARLAPINFLPLQRICHPSVVDLRRGER